MTDRIVLATGSEIRQTLLRNAGVPFTALPVAIDEAAMRQALEAEGVAPRDVADALAEQKARKASLKYPDALVIGCDQVLDFKSQILEKPETPQAVRQQLNMLAGEMHQLLSAAVIYQNAEPLWRHVGVVRLRMRRASPAYLDGYVDRNWASIRQFAGGYKLEEEGVRLFDRIDGDYFTVLGLPLLELLAYLTLKGTLPG